MVRAARGQFERNAFAVFLALTAPLAASHAQPAGLLKSIDKLYSSLAKPEQVIDREQAREAARRLEAWRVDDESLPPESLARVTAIRTYIALAEGEATQARKHYKSLDKSFAASQDGLRLGYLVACACGDAQDAARCLSELRRLVERDARRRLAVRRRWLRMVGQRAPDVTIRTDEMEEIPVRRRLDRVLLIDFWNTLKPPPDEDIQALCDLYERIGRQRNVQFVGVNADPEERIDRAREFAKQHGFEWPQRYEGTAVNAPLTHEAFHAGSPPWLVLIDTSGYIRAVGTAREPGFRYALRAAIREARGDAEPVRPRTREGREAVPAAPSDEAAQGKKKDETAAPQSNPEAANLLKQARVYLRLGQRQRAKELLRRIVREYPGTLEARKAQEYLDNMP